jgi:hypothetical protein
MSAARTSEWTTPAPAREDYATHRTTCPVCRIFVDECVTGRALRAEADELVANALARRARDARIARGERLAIDDVDPPYVFNRVVLRLGRPSGSTRR